MSHPPPFVSASVKGKEREGTLPSPHPTFPLHLPSSSRPSANASSSSGTRSNLVLVTSTISPPTPAPSPRPHDPRRSAVGLAASILPWMDLPNSPTSEAGDGEKQLGHNSVNGHRETDFSTSPASFITTLLNLPRAELHLFLRDLLNALPPTDLHMLSQLLSPLLKRDFIRDLPPELGLRILHFVSEDPRSLARCALVSRSWRNIVTDDEIWRVMCRRRGFEGEAVRSPVGSSDNLDELDVDSETTTSDGEREVLEMEMGMGIGMSGMGIVPEFGISSSSLTQFSQVTDATSNTMQSERSEGDASASASESDDRGMERSGSLGSSAAGTDDDSIFSRSEEESEDEYYKRLREGRRRQRSGTERLRDDNGTDAVRTPRAVGGEELRAGEEGQKMPWVQRDGIDDGSVNGARGSTEPVASASTSSLRRPRQRSEGSDSTAEESLIASKVLRGTSPTPSKSPRNQPSPYPRKPRTKSLSIHKAVSQPDIYELANANGSTSLVSETGRKLAKPRGYSASSSKTHLPFTYKSHFKRAYLTESAWLRGPDRLITTQVASDDAVVTTLSYDDDWIAVGMTSSQIHIFSAVTGQYVRSLQGHEQGVWCLTLVSGSGRTARKAEAATSWSTMKRSSSRSPLSRSEHSDSEASSELEPEQVEMAWHSSDIRHSASAGPSSPSDTPEVAELRSRGGRRPSSFHAYDRERNVRPIVSAAGGMGIGAGGPTGFSPQQSAVCGIARGWGQKNALLVSSGCDRDVRVWDVNTGACKHILRGHTSTVRCLKVLDGRPIAVSGSRDTTMRVWDIEKGECKKVLIGHEHAIRAIDAWGNQIVSASYDCTARLWDLDTGKCILVYRGHFHQIYSVAFDGTHIATGSLDSTVRIWSPNSAECLAVLQGHTSLVGQLYLSPEALVTAGSDGRVIVFSLSTFQTLHRICAHDNSVTCLQYDSRFIVTGGNDGKVKLFDLKTGAFIRELLDEGRDGAIWKVAFRDDKYVVVSRREGKTVLDVRSFRPLE
ncbi:WD40 repeat-like protein [Atractiella rhizophila]|nr:WD40 repeat-like protein [Atractiella rhizophila]